MWLSCMPIPRIYIVGGIRVRTKSLILLESTFLFPHTHVRPKDCISVRELP